MEDERAILEHIYIAREHAKHSNYDGSLFSYGKVRKLLDYELRACKNPSKLSIWKSMINDIISEEAEVRRIREMLNVVLKKISPKEEKTLVGSGKARENNAPLKIVRSEASELKKTEVEGHQRVIRPSAPVTVKIVKEKKKDCIDEEMAQQIFEMGMLIKNPNVEWSSIAGLDRIKSILRKHLVLLPMRPDICKGVLAPWKSVLFYGPPGTGKTFLAKAVATECKRTFFNVTSATITSKWFGDSEKLISTLFQMAEQMAPSTIFFDEIDSIASHRGSGNEHETSRRMKAQLLTQLEGLNELSSSVFVLAATNFPWDLDEAVLRRFQKRIYIPLPDLEAITQILDMSLHDVTDSSFDFATWATKLKGYSCSDVINVCKDAAQAALERATMDIDPEVWVTTLPAHTKIIVQNGDFDVAMHRRKSSVDAKMLDKYEEWCQSKGAE